MSVEKKSLINNMTATKKAIIASNTNPSPVIASKHFSKPGVSMNKPGVAVSKHLSKSGVSLNKPGVAVSKHFSKTFSKTFSKKA